MPIKVISGIYRILNKATGQFYVGSSDHINRRTQKHMKDLSVGNHHSIKLQRSYKKHGADAFEIAVIEVVEIPLLIEREQHWIDTLNACKGGYNMAPVAGSPRGTKRTLEQRAKMSAARKGGTLTNEHKELLRIRSKANWQDPEYAAKVIKTSKDRWTDPIYREKITASIRNRVMSPETCEKIRLALTGKKRTPEQKLRMKASRKNLVRVFTKEDREASSKKFKALWQDEAYREKTLGNRVFTEETRMKISASLVGRPRSEKQAEATIESNKNRVWTEEAKLKISKANTGKRRTPEWIAAMAAFHTGRKDSPEIIAKRAASNTGKKRTPEQIANMREGHRLAKERRNQMKTENA